MTDPNQPPAGWQQPQQQGYGQPPQGFQPYPVDPNAPPPMPYRMQGTGELGQVRSTGACIGLFFITLGVYSLYWFYQTHEEMKRHSGEGLGGAVALLIAFFIGFVSPFLHSNEVGKLHQRRGQQPPVTALNGLWYIPGILILVGPIVWFVRTNNALNDYWKSLGAAS